LHLVFCHIDACSINQEILDLNAHAMTITIQRSIAVDQGRINDNLDFIHPALGQLGYDETSLAILVSENTELVERSRQVFRHNRLGMFVKECQEIHDREETESVKKYAIYLLLNKVLKNINRGFPAVQDHQPSCRLSEESKASTDTSSSEEERDDMLCDKDISIFMEHQAATLPVQKLSLVDLDPKSFSESSFTYFGKQLLMVKHPIRVTSDLQHLRMDQLDKLSNTINTIDGSHNLAEVILMNGSSRKFNRIFSVLQLIYNRHVEAAKPITIVYSTTSETQVAYKKLYTLRGVIALPHSHLDEIIDLTPSLTLAIQSPEKKSRVIEVQEEEAENEAKLNQVGQKLKDFTQPLIIQVSKNLSKLSDLFAQLTVTS